VASPPGGLWVEGFGRVFKLKRVVSGWKR
jgi:hypothetical protein